MPSILTSLAAAAILLAPAVMAYDDTLCGESGYHSKGDRFAFYPNAWNPDDDGFTCMAITEDPPEFDVTWNWPNAPNNVNSFPHIKFQNTNIPSSLAGITSLKLKASWGIGDGKDGFPVEAIKVDDLDQLGIRCNVGWDMFAAGDSDAAQAEVNATTEIMIWLGKFGDPWPLGFKTTSDYPTQKLGDLEFNLYHGTNGRDQKVLTWIATDNITEFDEDALPLLKFLLDNDLVDGNEIMGLVEFGSETFVSNGNVTFSAYDMDVIVETDDPEDFAVPLARSLGFAFAAFILTVLFLL